jgi:hypothetical protein
VVFGGAKGSTEEWSVLLDLASMPARLRFLVEAAPTDLLVPDLRLELREGRRAVGYATVLRAASRPRVVRAEALSRPVEADSAAILRVEGRTIDPPPKVTYAFQAY